MTKLDKEALIEAMGKAIEHELLTGDHDCLALNEIVVAKAALRALAEALPDLSRYYCDDGYYRQLKEFACE